MMPSVAYGFLFIVMALIPIQGLPNCHSLATGACNRESPVGASSPKILADARDSEYPPPAGRGLKSGKSGFEHPILVPVSSTR
jgi:hypothetical protein